MKTSFPRYVLHLLLLCLCCCAKEEEFPPSSPYPVLKMISVTPGPNGTEVEGEFVSLGKTPITEYGFTYTTSSGFATIKKAVVGTTAQKGTFKATLTANLKEGMAYNVHAYAITNGYTIYSSSASFNSASSSAPVIHDFNPKAALDGTLITIVGESFSMNKQEVKVKIGDTEAQVVKASIDSIQVISPTVDFTGNFPITVIVGGKQQVVSKKTTPYWDHTLHIFQQIKDVPEKKSPSMATIFATPGGGLMFTLAVKQPK